MVFGSDPIRFSPFVLIFLFSYTAVGCSALWVSGRTWYGHMSSRFGWKKIVALIKKYEQLIRYFIFGVLSVTINYSSFWLFQHLWGSERALLINVLSFILATSFAYFTNKMFVFKSRRWSFLVVLKEMTTFAGGRIFSFLFEEVGLYVSITFLHSSDVTVGPVDGTMVAKVILSLIAAGINYCVSRFVVFRRKKGSGT